MKERDILEGQIFQTVNGNQYLIREHPTRGSIQFWIGNADMVRVDPDAALSERPNSECTLIGRVVFE